MIARRAWHHALASASRKLPRHLVRMLPVLAVCVLLNASCAETGLISGRLPVSVPSAVRAGMPLSVVVGPYPTVNGTPIGLIIVGAYGPRIYTSEFDAGVAQFIIPPEDTLQPGYIALIAAAGRARGHASVVLVPDRASRMLRPAPTVATYGISVYPAD